MSRARETETLVEHDEQPETEMTAEGVVTPHLQEDGVAADGDVPTGLEEAVEPSPEQQLAEARRETEELHDRFLRQGAEFQNYRKRMTREREQAVLDARATLLERLLPIVDNLERALEADAPEDALLDGVELVHRELLAQLEAEGARVEDPVGQPFDPERHEALSHEPVPGHEEGIVVEVFRKGYLLGDRLLRPALVKVAKGESAPAEDDSQTFH